MRRAPRVEVQHVHAPGRDAQRGARSADVVERFWVGRWELPSEAPHRTEMVSDPAVNLTEVLRLRAE
jgi:hypothetical protein